MPKLQVRYVCSNCGHESPRWLGRCPECDEWNSLQEEARVALSRTAAGSNGKRDGVGAVALSRVESKDLDRTTSGIGELDRALGGGWVPGAVILVGGDPGIGKSTLMTQAARQLSEPETGEGLSVLYVSGEESLSQLKLRCNRLGISGDSLFVASENNVNSIVEQMQRLQPGLTIIDSIQTCHDPAIDSAPGNVSQIRQCAAVLTSAAKTLGIPTVLIGHVTKEGSLAGPKVLEHMVDTVLTFEGDRHHAYRILRAVKNRFGSTDEIGIFEMRDEGLTEVRNPSALLLSQRSDDTTGSAVAAILEGSRPLLLEVQALISRSPLPNPRRTANGVELNRFHMLLAVMEKRLGLRLSEQDAFVNVAGGMRIQEPAADLALVLAIASGFRDQAVDPDCVLIGEVGLGGEVRAVSRLEQRVKEAARLGFKRAVISHHHNAAAVRAAGITAVSVHNVAEALQAALKPARK